MSSSNLKSFILHWYDGRTETVKGYDIADAFRRAGYGGGAVRALDYYEFVNEDMNNAPD